MTAFSLFRRMALPVFAALVGLFVVPAPMAEASVEDRAFTLRYTFTGRVDSLLIGNSTLNCNACVEQNGTGNNNSFNMIRIDVDADATTFTSSRATLSLPPGATVRRAFLYWGGDTSAGTGGAAAPNAAARNVVRLATPTAGYATVTAAITDISSVQNSRYSAVADVTAVVVAGGSGFYTVANVQSGTGQDRYGGWSLVVVISEPSLPLRSVTLFDGSATINTGAPSDLTVNVSGFRTPASGLVGARIGLVAFEGDNGFVGDQFRVNGTNISDAANPSNNVFNSTNSRLGALLTGREPQQSNLLGLDIDFIEVAEGVIANNATSANLTFTTTQDVYFPVALLFQTNVFEPEIVTNFTKSATDLNGGTFRPGDEVEYLIQLSNTGDDASDITVISDPLPAGVTFVPGSIEIVSGPNAGTKTDAAGDDQAEYDAGSRTLTVRVGVGADATTGGKVFPVPQANSATSVRFRATIDADQAGNSPSNVASVSFVGDTTRVPGSGTTNPSTFNVTGTSDVSVTKTGPATVLSGGAISYTVNVSNAGPDAAGGATVTDDVPDAITGVAITCAASGGAVCPSTTGLTDLTALAIPTLPSGGQVVFTITGTAPATATTLSNSASVAVPAGWTDPDTANNTAGPVVTTVGALADLSLSKTLLTAGPFREGQPVQYTIVVSNAGPDAATSVQITDTPSNLSITGVSGGGCTAFPCNIASIASGGSVTLTVDATISAPGAFDNAAAVTSSGTDPDPANNTDPSGNGGTALPAADLSVVKTRSTTATAPAGSTVAYQIVATNAGPSAVVGATLTDTVPPQLSAVTWACTPALACSASSGSGDVALSLTLSVGGSATITVSGVAPVTTPATVAANSVTIAPPAGTVDPSSANNTSTVPAILVAALPIDAVADTGTVSSGASGGVAVPNVLSNDTLDGASVTLSTVTLSPVSTTNPNVTLDPATGSVNVGPGTPAGTYTVTYRICEVLNPTNCDTATATVTVGAAPIDAVADTGTVSSGARGGVAVPNVLSNDTLDGASVTLSTVTLSPVSTTNPNVTLDPATGSVNVAPGTPAGTYTVTYRICEVLNPTNCDTATVTVTVNAAPIDAVDDGPIVQPATGGTTPSVIANDLLDGRPLVVVGASANANLTPGAAPTPAAGSITMNPDGTITIAPGTTPGTYLYTYTVCEILNPTNCDTATATIEVRPTITAGNDAPPNILPTGGPLPSIIGNDTVNGQPLVLVGPGANATLLPVVLPRPTSGGFVLNLDGTVVVLPGTTPGRYPFEYTVCVLPATTPATCSTATVILLVDELPAGTLVLGKVANVREASVGGVVLYTLSIANTGSVDVIGAEVVDVPPAGFSFIAGSATIDDADGLVAANGQRPIRFAGIDVPAGGRVTLRYLLRVGAAVPAGVHTNTATTFFAGLPASGSAQASVVTGGNTDPVFEQARLWGKVFDDRNGNGGQDDGEPGIPGVRLALVEGLVAETDRHGRYHVEGLVLSNLERGQNAIVKLDEATLPPGSELTTENPLLRRLTAGLPTRFDFGVRLPVQSDATREIDLVLGEVMFAPGRSDVQEAYRPVVQRIVDALVEHGGGEIVLTSGDAPGALTLRRAEALRDVALASVPAAVAARTRGRIDLPEGETAVALDETVYLGTVLFDTDRATIRPQYDDLIKGVAARIAASPVPMIVNLTGFADARASADYNLDLSRRRAAAVANALRSALPPEARDAVRVVVDGGETQP